LSPISFPCIFRFWVDWVGTFEWMWSYWHLNWARLDPNEMCIPFLPTSGGFQWRLYQSCSNEASKVINLFNLNCDIYFLKKKPPFLCSHLKLLIGFLSMALKSLS
jgi:hypothetical protein